MIGLLELLNNKEDCDLVEADLKSEYGVRLTDYYRGELSGRELLVYIKGLPASSRYVSKLAGPDGEWSRLEHFTADVIDLMKIILFNQNQMIQAKCKNPKKVTPPEMIDRPSDVARKLEEAKKPKKFASKEAFNSILGKQVQMLDPQTGRVVETRHFEPKKK